MQTFILFIGGSKDGVIIKFEGSIDTFSSVFPEYTTVIQLAMGQDICIGNRLLRRGSNVYAASVGLSAEDVALVLCNSYLASKKLETIRGILA